MPLKETDGFDDSDFYGFCGDFEENKGRWQLEIEGDAKYQERELAIYNGGTGEWKEAQPMYRRLGGNLGRQISLSIGFGRLRGKLSDRGGFRIIIMRKSRQTRQEINKNLPSIL